MSDQGEILSVLVFELPRYIPGYGLDDRPFLCKDPAQDDIELKRHTRQYFELLKGMLTTEQYNIFLKAASLTDEGKPSGKDIKITRGEIIVALCKACYPDRVSAADDEAAAAGTGTPANKEEAFRLKVAQLKELVLKSRDLYHSLQRDAMAVGVSITGNEVELGNALASAANDVIDWHQQV